MSAMSELHAEIAEIAVNDADLVRCFHSDNASHRWGMLTAAQVVICLLYTSPSPRDDISSRMPSSA